MHLLVLSAFRLREECSRLASRIMRLNAPSGAQCFPTRGGLSPRSGRSTVSMHLLVLSAFRPTGTNYSHAIWEVSMHLLVLSAFRRNIDD